MTVLQVFYLFDIVNAAGTPVKTAGPIVFDMPPGAKNATVIEGSTPLAFARGTQVTVEGPFAPGATSLQMACTLPQSGEATIALRLPIGLDQVTVMAEKVGDMVLTSAQLTNMRESADGAKRFLFASGPGLAAGEVLSFELTGLPHHPLWPRNLALVLAVVILGAGGWAAFRPGGAPGVLARRQLEGRRETTVRRGGAARPADRGWHARPGTEGARRAELVAELERIYGELDTEAGPGDDQGLAA